MTKLTPSKALSLRLRIGAAATMTLLPSIYAHADAMQACLLQKLQSGSDDMTAAAMREACKAEAAPTAEPVSAARERVQRERSTEQSPYVLSAHKQNYILPYTYADGQNPIYEIHNNEVVDNQEAKFQISFKFPLTENDLLVKDDSLHFGFTLKSFWQVYNNDVSAPFRETNYNPELFYTMPLTFRPQGADTALRFGAEHESNGRTQLLSRSWNRIYAQMFYAKDNYIVSFKPWYRIPEDKKDSPTDPQGDDNPDIEKYMGYFELNGAMKYKKFEFTALARNNLRTEDNYGALELGMSFPLWGRLRGFVQYFNGYGESLIDYNHRMERIGVGFLLTDLL